jgi:hypothetical protein
LVIVPEKIPPRVGLSSFSEVTPFKLYPTTIGPAVIGAKLNPPGRPLYSDELYAASDPPKS